MSAWRGRLEDDEDMLRRTSSASDEFAREAPGSESAIKIDDETVSGGRGHAVAQ